MNEACSQEMTSPPADAALDHLLDLFDLAWQNGLAPRIDTFLRLYPDDSQVRDHPDRRALLTELVKIDLEYRWRGHSLAAYDAVPERPHLEDYATRFPELGPLASLPAPVIAEEYRVRRRWGDRPGHAEYAARFPAQGGELPALLLRVDADLAAEALGADSFTPPPFPACAPATRSVCCPHCTRPVELATETWPEEVICPSCGSTFTPPSPAPPPTSSTTPPRSRVGRYELGPLLGCGGFGTVWGGYDPQLRREVAVKLPRSGRFADPAEEERFLREARFTAQLRHPGILPVYDVGRDGEFIYLVSELVRGPNLADWLAVVRPDFQTVAEGVAQVADALDYAHGRGIVHRDLKPANILLAEDRGPRTEDRGPRTEDRGQRTEDRGQEMAHRTDGSAEASGLSFVFCPLSSPTITDFGLAKRGAGEATLTREGQVLGTPAYMSPEQIRQPHTVDGRSDVYSLGVILYQLLTGGLPFRGAARMVLHQVLTEEPKPPRRWNDKIPRDLETITLKCLAKEASHRYRTAAELAADLRRWRPGVPIHARPWPRWYRALRWAKRRPAAAALVAVSALAAAGLLAGGLWYNARLQDALRATSHERDRAEEGFRQARAAVEEYFTKVSESRLLHRQGLQPLRKELLESPLHYYEAFIRQRGHDPALKGELATAYLRVGLITAMIGSKTEALAAHQRARALLQELVQAQPTEVRWQLELAVCYGSLGDVSSKLGNHKEALRFFEQGRDRREHLTGPPPDVARWRRDLAASYCNIGIALRMTNRPREALGALEQARRLQGQLVADHAAVPRYRQDLAVTYSAIGSVRHALGQWEDARQSYEEACALREQLARQHPAEVEYQVELAAVRQNLGVLLAGGGKFAETVTVQQQAAAELETIVRANPTVIPYQTRLATCLRNLAHAQVGAGQPALAVTSYQRACTLWDQVVQADPAVPDFRSELAATFGFLAHVQEGLGQKEEARRSYEQARAHWERLLAVRRGTADPSGDLASSYYNLGLVQIALGEWAAARDTLDEAGRLYDQLLARPEHLAELHLHGAMVQQHRGQVLRQLNRLEEALAAYQSAVAHFRAVLAKTPGAVRARQMLSDSYFAVAELQRLRRRPADAAAAALERRQLWPDRPGELYNVACELALCIPLVGKEGAELTDAERAAQRRYADLALEVLRQAGDQGFKDVKRLQTDADLAPLRSRPDFQQLLAELDSASPSGSR